MVKRGNLVDKRLLNVFSLGFSNLGEREKFEREKQKALDLERQNLAVIGQVNQHNGKLRCDSSD